MGAPGCIGSGRRAALLAIFVALAGCLPARAQQPEPGSPRVCRQGAVEMIVGGAAGSDESTCRASHTAAVSSTPPPQAAGSMRVGAETQRLRDIDRRQILSQELEHEEHRLELIKREREPDALALARKHGDVLALRRELARVPAGSGP